MKNEPVVSRRDAVKMVTVTALGVSVLGGAANSAAAVLDAPAAGLSRTRGLRLGVASYSLDKLPVEEVIEAVKQLEIGNVSLFRSHAPWGGTAEECRAAAQKFKDAGLTVTGTGVVELPNNEAAVRKAFDNARAAGLPAMMCKPALDAYPLIEKFVKEYDLRLAVHNHGPEDKVYPSAVSAWKAVQPYDKRIGLCIDVGHAARAGEDPVAAIRLYRERLYDVHLKDTLAESGALRDTPVEMGRGKLDIHGMLAALIEIKYPHIVAFEYEKRPKNVVSGLAESVGYVRGMLEGMAG